MFKSVARLFYGMFKIPFEEDSIIFKVKVEAGNQWVSAICWFKVYGYWKYKYDWTWNKLGVIYEIQENDRGGKWYESEIPNMLKVCQEVFVEQTRTGISRNFNGLATMEVTMREIISQVDDLNEDLEEDLDEDI